MKFENIYCCLDDGTKRLTLDVSSVDITYLRSKYVAITKDGHAGKYYAVLFRIWLINSIVDSVSCIINLYSEHPLKKLVSRNFIIKTIEYYCNNTNLYMESYISLSDYDILYDNLLKIYL